MVWVFNRREAALCMNLEQLERVRGALEGRGIGYRVKTLNRGSPGWDAGSRVRSGSAGQQPMAGYSYRVFVRKEDLDAAKAALIGQGR